MRGLYLCARKHRIEGYNIDYNDIGNYEGLTYKEDMRNLLTSGRYLSYDYLIATPPCNYYSRANYRRNISKVALETKDLLPMCIDYFMRSGKPFIIENVNNSSLLPNATCYMFDFGGHTFYSNVLILVPHKSYARKQNKAGVCRNKRDGNYNVDLIIRLFLEMVTA